MIRLMDVSLQFLWYLRKKLGDSKNKPDADSVKPPESNMAEVKAKKKKKRLKKIS